MTKRGPRREVTRFAPSPTGHLHLGHAFSALTAWRARGPGGDFLLRIEDIDRERCREEYVDAIFEDLAWLGLDWERPVLRQSEQEPRYREALAELERAGFVYPCFCARSDIKAEIARAGGAPHGPDGPVYPGLCRGMAAPRRRALAKAGRPSAARLDTARAAAAAGPLSWSDGTLGEVRARPERFGDIVLARKNMPAGYHLAVVADDGFQGVTLVTRGEDLAPHTDVHRLLQALLGLAPPAYRHHRLVRGADGRRLAKRDRDLTIRALRDAGHGPDEVARMAGGRPP